MIRRSRTIWLFYSLVALLFGLGEGAASADSMVGSTYADAAAKIAQQGATAVIATRTGDSLKTDECIVTSTKKSGARNSSGAVSGDQVLVNLNCDPKLAKPGAPGMSAATPEGREAKKLEAQAVQIRDHYEESCGDGPKAWLACKAVCDETKMCEVS